MIWLTNGKLLTKQTVEFFDAITFLLYLAIANSLNQNQPYEEFHYFLSIVMKQTTDIEE